MEKHQRFQFDMRRLMAATMFVAVASLFAVSAIRNITSYQENEAQFRERFRQGDESVFHEKHPTFVDVIVVPVALFAGMAASAGAALGLLFGHARLFAAIGAIIVVLGAALLFGLFILALSGITN